ncbi:hypothetical protein [Paenibacillus sp. YN15]|uniref:hypothetical protein n=1 Tax=Paenibacillus sp. YN15 TaxID=1742774 RepID=UPI000DCE0ABF|nr:hypothetical protein [Paenibacillus sp. YN15]RAU99807.1 hypothetical protein DQG13_14985 [Paenibacillus sp. YN15]
MVDPQIVATFVIISFCFALVLLMKKDAIAPSFKRGLAIMAVVMVSFSFFLILYSLFTMGR